MKKQKTIKNLKSALWKIVSEITRRTGADWRGWNTCYTCLKKIHWKELNAGHFKHNKLDFDLRNLKPQCPRCNLWGHGKLDIYATRLVEENGLEWVKELERNAAQKGNDYSREELLLLTDKFKQQLLNL